MQFEALISIGGHMPGDVFDGDPDHPWIAAWYKGGLILPVGAPAAGKVWCYVCVPPVGFDTPAGLALHDRLDHPAEAVARTDSVVAEDRA